MIKKLMAVGLMGLGLVAAQGCAVEQGTSEETGVAADAVSACYTNYGVNTTKAALMVAMADELGRWDPAHDLQIVQGSSVSSLFPNVWQVVMLNPSAVCLKNSCKNTKAILGQQDQRLINVIDQNIFSPAGYNADLIASFNRQSNALSDLARNSPAKLPPAHKLTKVGGPVDLGLGACGPHYVFQADHRDGTPLSSTEATNLSNGLCFYGFGNCGNGNPYIKYTITGQGCPTGRTCVAVDPSDGDNGTTTTTTAGSAPAYPGNRVYDPTNVLLGSACTMTSGRVTTLISKCSIMPATCNYLYCN